MAGTEAAAFRLADGRPLPPPLEDTSPEGLLAAIEADTVATRVLNGELLLEPHLDADASWAAAGIVDPFRNVVASARFSPLDADRRIAELQASFRDRGTAFLWWRAPFHSPDDLGERLERAGIWSVGSGPAMAMALADLPPVEPSPDGLEIRPVTDVAGLRDYIGVLATDPPPPGAPPTFRPEVAERILGYTGPRLALEPTPMRYVGWHGGRPVATARLSLAGGAAGIYAVHTIDALRGRGIGRAMTLAPLRAARDLGYRVATLQSTEAGYPVYRRIGFRDVTSYEIHVGNAPRPDPG